MGWLWPGMLVLLLLPLFLAAGYIWALRRRRRYTVRYSSLALLRAAQPQQSRLRRHLPFVLLLVGMASMLIAMGRPVAVVSVPTNQTTIVLAMDVSRSMCATDIEPSRLAAAEAAALSFVERQQPGTRIGLVAFAGFAEIVQPPTTDQQALQSAITSLTTGRRTAIGSGILTAIDAIAEFDSAVAPSVRASSDEPLTTPVPRGAYAPAIIVLLTDGASNSGMQPLEAAQQAADRGLRVYTIGFGTENGSGTPFCPPALQGGGQLDSSGGFGGGGFGGGGGGGFRRGIDEATLIQVAELTGGEYYSAESAGELEEVFRNLPTSLITRHETTEISVFFTAIGALLAAVSLGLALRWNRL